MSIIVLQSSWWGRESWLLCWCLVIVFGSSSRCQKFVCSLWSWYFLIIHTYYFLDSYLKDFRRYVPDSMQILETRSEVKVTMTQGWYTTLRHRKMHPNTKFGIPSSNNMRYAPDTIILKTRSEVKVIVTRRWYATLRHPKMHQHTKLGWPLASRLWCLLWVCHFPICILGQVWYLIVSIPDICALTYFGIPTSKNIEAMHQTRCRF